MIVEQFQMGGDRNFGYLLADEASGEAMVIDPSFDPAKIARYADENGYRIRFVLSTHGHADHTNGNTAIGRLCGVSPLLFGDTCPDTGTRVADGAVFMLGELEVRVIHTPGHTPDSICLHAGNAVFTGDTLFTGKIGGTYTEEQARQEYDSLHLRLMVLPSGTRVFPGHDYGDSPVSTIGRERTSNPFLLRDSFEGFLDLKENWAAYKKAHGIP
ncbi:MAG: MBL fold metallo-hydrolase [Chlorobiaceae bacterium]|nr:MBL fold metallo-hydrolase [Chlorobiaceae bacterium]NTW10907.1 MBL fold metallo-hydrolase [Chlorobiaceae bacterium]